MHHFYCAAGLGQMAQGASKFILQLRPIDTDDRPFLAWCRVSAAVMTRLLPLLPLVRCTHDCRALLCACALPPCYVLQKQSTALEALDRGGIAQRHLQRVREGTSTQG